MGKPGKTKMVNLGPKQKYGLKMDHGAKQKVPKMTTKPAVTGNIHGEPSNIGSSSGSFYYNQQQGSSNPSEAVKNSPPQRDVRMRGATQMSKTDKGINYMMGAATRQEIPKMKTRGAQTITPSPGPTTTYRDESYNRKYEKAKDTINEMKADGQKPTRDDYGYYKTYQGETGAAQMKTGIYQDRMNGKLPQNPVLMQYGMDKNAVKQVGKHMAMPQTEGGEEKIVAGNKNKGMLDEVTVEASRPRVQNVDIGRNWKGDYVRADASVQPAADYNAAFTNWASTAEGYGGFNERIANLKATGKTEDARQANAAIRLAKQDFNRTDLGRNLMTKVHDSSIAPDEGGNRKTMSVRSDQLSKYGFSDEG